MILVISGKKGHQSNLNLNVDEFVEILLLIHLMFEAEMNLLHPEG